MRLDEWRLSRSLSHTDLASVLGVTRPAISRYLGGRLPKTEVLSRIIAVTGGEVTPNDWFVSIIQRSRKQKVNG